MPNSVLLETCINVDLFDIFQPNNGWWECWDDRKSVYIQAVWILNTLFTHLYTF